MSSSSAVLLETTESCTDAEADAPEATAASPTDRRKAARATRQAESRVALQALEAGIIEARRRTLSTLIGFSAVAAVGTVAFGLVGARHESLVFALVPLALMVCGLCWRRERALTRAEYLSLPHSEGRNGRLRCIHCGTLGDPAREAQAMEQRRRDCPKCRTLLFG
jgi:hypothetical protein